ncbi:putative gustatory receptor 2a [Rhagoletis pomonella]|uniref:putative gustatory receptor 2a n=1 Tax=Rhagoletis pomonella TaxID=28610 RepID=UPI00177D2F8A|nr:putative gustatory receptor 2a [Rhagoletis pomonella]
MVYTIGFSIGIYQLHSKSHNRVDGISHWTSWAQLFTLFILGFVAWVTAWTHMDEQCQLCALVFKIDKQLREFAEIEFDYKLLRKRLFYQLGLELLIAFPLSMVNCMIIQPTTTFFLPITACYWFICVAPISLLIFKQFQFYNQMYILKTKFELINCKLSRFNRNGVLAMARRRIVTVRKINSVSEIPLTAVPISAAHSESVALEEPNVEILQNLLMIYSSISDGIDLVLRIFAWHLLAITAVSFGVITIQSYNLFILMTHSLALPTHHVFFIIAWILVQVMAIAMNVRICSSTSRTMDATVSLLHKMRCSSNAAPNACVFYQMLQLFSMEVLQRKRNFNAAGFFDMDYKLITSIFASVTTYLVIIIQFHFTSVPDGHFANHSVY